MVLLLAVVGCELEKPIPLGQLTDDALAQEVCSRCHDYPEPNLLTRSSWEKILPQQRHFLGLVRPGENPYRSARGQEAMYLEVANVYPSEPVLADSLWSRIEHYYLDHALSNKDKTRRTRMSQTPLFKADLIAPDLGGFPAVCLLDYSETENLILVGDINGQVAQLSSSFEVLNLTKLNNPVVDIQYDADKDQLLMLDVGLMDAKDLPLGAVVSTDLGSFSQRALLFEELFRPVDMVQVDWDEDGQLDLIVCEFGNLTGRLSWYRRTAQGYEHHILLQRPGAVQAEAVDWDDDGDKDLLVLFAQANEGLVLFENLNQGRTEVHDLLSFHPLMGSSSFAVADFDDDGDLDIIHTGGDNSTTHYEHKAYQGVRIYENQGDRLLVERYALPMHGAYKAVSADFDQDGDRDIMVCAFYPDFSQVDQSLIFLEASAPFEFRPQQVEGADQGRWMVMDVGDIDRDGDVDVMVGSFLLGPGIVPQEVLRPWINDQNHILVLRNQSQVSD